MDSGHYRGSPDDTLKAAGLRIGENSEMRAPVPMPAVAAFAVLPEFIPRTGTTTTTITTMSSKWGSTARLSTRGRTSIPSI